MERLVDARGAVLIGHTHNERAWCPSHGQPLSHEGYANLFETIEPRIFGEAGLFADVVKDGPLDLARHDTPETLDQDPALAIIASRHAGVFARHDLDRPGDATGEFRLNPLYAVEPDGDCLRLRLRFPSDDYEQEYRACRQYLPEELTLNRSVVASLATGRMGSDLADLLRRRVVVDLPSRYY